MFLLLPWVKHIHGREGERMPLKEDTLTSTSGYASTSTNMESESRPQSALGWPRSLPPIEEFFLHNEEDHAMSLPTLPNP